MPRRSVLAVLLSAFVVALSVAAGHARGQAPAAGHAVLCTGHGTVTIAVDADGAPIGMRVLCPDCALTLLAGVAPPVPALGAVPGPPRRLGPTGQDGPTPGAASRPAHRPRAPPA